MYPFTSSSASPTTAPPSVSNSTSTWGPSAEHFDINVASILVVLVLASIVAFVLHAFIRFLLLRCRQQYYRSSSSSSSPKHPKIPAFSLVDEAPASIYSPGATELAGGAECSICLTEFLDGDRVRVLPACNHGFHVRCVEKWLVSKSSCPTCRTSCRPTAMATADPEP